MQVRRGELDLDPALVVVAAVKALEQRDAIVERELKAVVPALHRPVQFGWQGGEEIFVALVDEPVLVAQCKGIRHPHADVLIGADHLARTGLDRGEIARQPAM